MYGDGLIARSALYIWNGWADVGLRNRCATTAWITSPATTYSFTASTIDSYSCRDMFDSTCPSGGGPDGWGGICSGPVEPVDHVLDPAHGVAYPRSTSPSSRA